MKRQYRSRVDRLRIWGARILAGFAIGLVGITVTSLPVPLQAHEWLTDRMTELRQANHRWIEVNVSTQRLIAWEGNMPVYAVVVSTGTADHPTLTGAFVVQSKHATARMRGEDYDVPDVPYVMYYDGNYGIHGTYWHNQFGTPMSHGCINVAVDHAEWLFQWASIGTPVVVHD